MSGGGVTTGAGAGMLAGGVTTGAGAGISAGGATTGAGAGPLAGGVCTAAETAAGTATGAAVGPGAALTGRGWFQFPNRAMPSAALTPMVAIKPAARTPLLTNFALGAGVTASGEKS